MKRLIIKITQAILPLYFIPLTMFCVSSCSNQSHFEPEVSRSSEETKTCKQAGNFTVNQQTGKPLPGRINSMAMTADGKKLLALTEDDLFVVNPATLSPISTITIKAMGGRDLSSYWSADNMVMSPDQEHVLVLDKYITLGTGKPAATLDIASAVKKGNPNPTALDISPSGKLGLILVYSFSAAKHNSLAVFDLETGKLMHSRQTGETVVNAVFASEEKLMLFYADGRVTIEDFKGKLQATLTKNGPVPRPGTNSLAVAGSGKKRGIIASGRTGDNDNCVFAFCPLTRTILFQDNCDGCVSAKANSKWVFYQESRISKILCECGQHPLFDLFIKARNIESGQVKEHKIHKLFDIMMFGSKPNIVFCSDYDTVTKFEIPDAFMRDGSAEKQVKQISPTDGRVDL